MPQSPQEPLGTKSQTAGNPIELTEAEFTDALSEHPLAIVDFWAPWCGPCRAFSPVFARSAAEHPEVFFAKVNVDESPSLARRLLIRSIPTVVSFVSQRPVAAHAGALPPATLEAAIKELLDHSPA